MDAGIQAGKDVIITKCEKAGITLGYDDVDAIAGGDGGYEIDGMPWDEWLDAQMMD